MTRPLRRLAITPLLTATLTSTALSCAPDPHKPPAPASSPAQTSSLTPRDAPPEVEEEAPPEPEDEEKPEPAPLLHLAPEDPRAAAFTRACEPGERVTVGAVGDILMHRWLQEQGVEHEDRFRSMFTDLVDLWGQVDLLYANLEGTTAQGVRYGGKRARDPGFAYDHRVYTGYPRFNTHKFLIEDLVKIGVDVVSTANNHSLDRQPVGVDRTIDALEEFGLPYFGTRRSDHRKAGVSDAFHTVTEVRGHRIAWVACTHHTNGRKDPHGQVLFCHKNERTLLRLIGTLADDPDVHAVIVTPHWGKEYQYAPRKKEQAFGVKLLEAGATAVLGNHPHVPQPWQIHTTEDGRQGFIHYSLGNLVSALDGVGVRSAPMIVLGLTRPADGGKMFVHGVRYLPLYMYHYEDRSYVRDIERGPWRQDAWDLVTHMYGPYNLQSSKLPLTTSPQCDPSWSPPDDP